MTKVFKDYCGVLTEESIRKNFLLIYELLDEMLDFGYPQITSTELLKNCVHNEAIEVAKPSIAASVIHTMSGSSTATKSSMLANTPITLMNTRSGGSNSKNEIYVDIIERLTILFNSSGFIVNSSIDGSILMKSFLSGNDEIGAF
jgi:AP-4 complex subunit mu-1